MDFDLAIRLGSIAVAIGSLGWTIIVWRIGARKAELDQLGQRIDGVAARLTDHEDAGQDSRSKLDARLGQVEATLMTLPDKDAVHKLELSVTEIHGKINTQGETLRAVSATASRVEQFLLDGAKGR